MKRIIIIVLCLFICACKSEVTNNNTVKNIIEIPKYVDENPVKISLYVDNVKGGLSRVTDEYNTTWIKKKDIVVFGSIFSEDEELGSDYFQNIWKKNALKYEDYNKYKTGWKLSFSLKNGQTINQVISKPSDVDSFYDYLEVYLYDSANATIGVWYSHLLDEQMTNETIMTSMKLTAGSNFEEINSPIEVTIFTYDTLDDFDENGNYIGNSKKIINVYNK